MSDAARLLSALERVNRALTSATQVDDVFEAVLATLQDALGYTSASFMAVDPSGDELVVRAGRGGAKIGTRVAPGPSLSWHAMERRTPIVLSGRAGAEYATPYTKDIPFSIVAPLVVGARTLGVLNLNRDSHPGEEALSFVRTLADMTAFAMERFELHEDLQHFTEQLLAQEEEQRRRLARDLHDGLAPILVSAHAQLQSSASRDEQVERATQLIRKAIQETREIIVTVRPATLDDLGLAGAIAAEAQDIAEEAGWTLESELDDPGPLSRDAESALYRVTLEALQNVKAHAAAHNVRFSLRRDEKDLEITIADDGHGFQIEQWGEAGVRPGHFGLLGMRERVSFIGGRCEVTSRPGEGTTVRITVPRDRLR